MNRQSSFSFVIPLRWYQNNATSYSQSMKSGSYWFSLALSAAFIRVLLRITQALSYKLVSVKTTLDQFHPNRCNTKPFQTAGKKPYRLKVRSKITLCLLLCGLLCGGIQRSVHQNYRVPLGHALLLNSQDLVSFRPVIVLNIAIALARSTIFFC